MRMAAVVAAVLVAVGVAGGGGFTSVPTKRYLLALHSCEQTAAFSCNDPRAHRIQLAESDDGVSWAVVAGWQSFTGSVPDAIRRGDTLYLYWPAKVAKLDLRSGTLSAPVTAQIDGLPVGLVDPSPVQDAEGRIVLFGLPGVAGQDPAMCARGESACTKQIVSATEVPGSDGTRFTLDPGARITVALTPGVQGGLFILADPDVFWDGSRYVLYVSHGPSVGVHTSSELKGTYVPALPGHGSLLVDRLGGVPSGYLDPATGRLWTYVHTNVGAVTVIRRAVHDGLRPLTESDFQTVLTATAIGLPQDASVASPGFVVNEPGRPLVTAPPAASKPTATAKATATPTPAAKATTAKQTAKQTTAKKPATKKTPTKKTTATKPATKKA